MIENEKQYQITTNWIKEFNDAKNKLLKMSDEEFNKNNPDVDLLFKKLQIDAYTSQIETLKREVNEYYKKDHTV